MAASRNVWWRHDRLPEAITKRKEKHTQTYVTADSTEGWGKAPVLLSRDGITNEEFAVLICLICATVRRHFAEQRKEGGHGGASQWERLSHRLMRAAIVRARWTR